MKLLTNIQRGIKNATEKYETGQGTISKNSNESTTICTYPIAL